MKPNNLLTHFISEVVRASPEYMKKERVREALQGVITSLIASGEIANQADLDAFFGSADMSLRALKMVPFDVYTKLAKR